MSRTRYLLCYDIRDEVRLRRTAKVAIEFGYRIQYSIYICDLSEVERIRLEGRLRQVIDVKVDRVLLVDLGQPHAATSRRLHWICGTVPVPLPGDPTIV